MRTGALARIDADLRTVAAELGELRTPPAKKDSRAGRRDLTAGLGEAAGANAVSAAVASAFRHDAALATGWPFTRWLRRFRRHPLRKLRPATSARPGPQTAIPIDEPRLQLALKTYADTGPRSSANWALASAPSPVPPPPVPAGGGQSDGCSASWGLPPRPAGSGCWSFSCSIGCASRATA